MHMQVLKVRDWEDGHLLQSLTPRRMCTGSW